MENLRISDPAAAGDAGHMHGQLNGGQNQDAGGNASFTSHMTILDTGSAQFIVRVLKMNGSTMLIINSKECEVFDELAVAMPPRDSTKTDALSSTIMGGYGQTESSVLAAKLSKRYHRQFFVSLNIGGDRLVTPLFEKSLVTYMQNHLDHFV